jgi:hypothetical protein
MEPTLSFSAELAAPYELRAQTPRRTTLTGSGIQMMLATAILLAIAAAATVWAFRYDARQTRRNSALLQTGQRTVATITQFQSEDAYKPTVDYTFTAGGATYAGHAVVPVRLAHSLSGAGSLPILYVPANPAINRPAGWQHPPIPEAALFAAPAFSALLGLLLFVPMLAERRMAVHGTPVLAVVTKCTRARHGYLLNYALRLEDGSPVKGHGWYETYQEPSTGIWTLHLPGNPRRNRPYPLTYCRAIQ